MHLVLRLRGGGGVTKITNISTGQSMDVSYIEGMRISELK
jgi:hypothetical protein